MIAEALKFLSDQAQKALSPARLPIDDPRNASFVVNGKIEARGLPPAPRQHTVDSLDDLIAIANRFGETPEAPPVVWYDDANVVLVIDDDEHRVEQVWFPLAKSAVFETLLAMESVSPPFDQKPFLRLLRIDLTDTGDEVARLIEAVRRVKFENGVTTTGHVTRGQESLGREITSKVEALQAPLPELVTVHAPIYRTPGERDRYGVRCAVEVDPALGKFQLVPLPDELGRVVQIHLSTIRDRLDAGLNSALCYSGRP